MLAPILTRATLVKQKLVAFGKIHFGTAYAHGLGALSGNRPERLSEEEVIVFTDWFVFEFLVQDNRTVLSFFIEQAQDEADILIARQWKTVIHGVFHLKKLLADNIFQLHNLVNDVIYTVTSTTQAPLALEKGEFISAKIIPLENFHVFTGLIDKLQTRKKEDIYNLVSQIQLHNPKMAFVDNIQRLEQAYRIQEEEYQDFMTFFGSDEIVLSGSELPEKLREFYHYRYFQKKEQDLGTTIAKTFQEKYHQLPQIPTFEFLPEVLDIDQIGLLYDKVEGLVFLMHYDRFREIFVRPDFRRIKNFRKIIQGYLEDPAISSLPFKRMAREFPENAEKVFKAFLKKKRFSLATDLPQLVTQFKPQEETLHLTPSIIPMLVKSKTFLKSLKINKNDPCPCGSGRKYRFCCGAI